jgi:hypothetical protein
MRRINIREPELFETLCKCRLVHLTKVWETTKPHQICLTTQINDGSLSAGSITFTSFPKSQTS